MKLKSTKRLVAKGVLIAGAFLLALPMLAALDVPAEAESEQSTQATTATADSAVNYASLGLADRNSIQLDENEKWFDKAMIYTEYNSISEDGTRSNTIACNSPFGHCNTQKNHYGLYSWSTIINHEDDGGLGGGHAGAFKFDWSESKGAYAIGTYWELGRKYTGCTYKWWNLADKKTKNHTKIQTWTGGTGKNENLFWVSWNVKTDKYRIWSALAGRPVGYTSSDHKNLQTLDKNEAGTIQWFDIEGYLP